MASRRSSYPSPAAPDVAMGLPASRTTQSRRTANDSVAGGPTAAVDLPLPAPTSTSQQQLHDYRERLALDLERRELQARGLLNLPSDKARVSPIPEEIVTFSPPWTSHPTTSSTESGNTVRGGATPGPIASTPSYPFPRMPKGSSHGLPPHLLQSHGSSSPTSRFHVTMPPESRGTFDSVNSESSTPASTFAFNNPGMSRADSFDSPTPDLYQLSLLLAAEPGLEAWWNTVVQIMRDIYKAERVTLAVPADTADIENVPWGQKATYNEKQQDDLSLAYMTKGGTASSIVQSSDADGNESFTSPDELAFQSPEDQDQAPKRPGFPTRHSFTTYEDKKKRQDGAPPLLRRPTNVDRSDQARANIPLVEISSNHPPLEQSKLKEHDAEEEDQNNVPSWEMPFLARYGGQGLVLPVLQALDYEADPLIDHSGVMRVLERGKAVALTRTYPYLPRSQPPQGADAKSSSQKAADGLRRSKMQRSESSSSLSSILPANTPSRGKSQLSDAAKTLASADDESEARPITPRYEEYEQSAPSPWSQSPAPSPAVRPDPKENPFFTDAMVDETSFNPGSSPTDYTHMQPPEALGLENSWTVLHIPLHHVLLSKQSRSSKIGAADVIQQEYSSNGDRNTPEAAAKKDKPAPIAILSILSPVIPYPATLRHSLERLAPHMATSFSLCRQYTNLETELAGIQRRRPETTGFGAVAPYGHSLDSGAMAGDIAALQSVTGSMTSPSDYSAVSKSATGSPIVTPGWEQGSLGQIMGSRSAVSPAAGSQGSGGYFSSKHTSSSSRLQEARSPGYPRMKILEKNAEKRNSRSSATNAGEDGAESRPRTSEESTGLSSREQNSFKGGHDASSERMDDFLNRTLEKSPEHAHMDHQRAEPTKQMHQKHTRLHSYGADFATTFQSLPSSSALLSRPLPTPLTSGSLRSISMTSSVGQGDLPPPTDRLQTLILDTLPAHVFVALPQTGEIVWVNSRYLSYRGLNVASLVEDPWGSIHPDDRDDYLKDWGHSLRTGEQFSRSVRIKRFDGKYRWFYARAVGSRDKRGVIVQFLGSYMDIHDQHIAELKAARQEEIEVSEAKHRLLANLIPQIIFTATEDDGITFANEQWLSYTGQGFEDALGLGFLDFVHPEDLAKCRIPKGRRRHSPLRPDSDNDETPSPSIFSRGSSLGEKGFRHVKFEDSTPPRSVSLDQAPPDLLALAKKGIVRITRDSSGRLSYTSEVRLRSKEGEYRWHLIRCVEIDTIDFGRGASSYFGSATDINDHKLLEAKLKEAMESKGRFLSNMSHEIRTPLIGISGMVSFLQDTLLDEEQRDYTNTIHTSANSLIMIINDILDLSKADAGMMKLKYEWFHTRSLIEDVNELVSTMAIAKGLELNYLVEADVPAWVKGDKVRIRQVLLNVIGNAIKFTEQGEVFSHCKVFIADEGQTGENEIMLEFSITDTGRGFSEAEAELIFKPFSQIDGSSTRQHGGSGLGLVISRQLVELHGGKMEGTAVLGKGSTFTFTAMFSLPTPVDQPALPQSPGSTMSILSRQDSSDGSKASPPIPGSQTKISAATLAPRNAMGTASTNPPTGGIQRKPSDAGVGTELARFGEAAKASGQDLSQMKLEMPSGVGSPGRPLDQAESFATTSLTPPQIYNILVVCPQRHSRDATVQHIEMTLPKEVPHQITAIGTKEESERLIGGDDPISFTHIVINLGSAEAIIALMDEITKTQRMDKTMILVLSDSVQRQAVLKLAIGTKYEKMLSENAVTFIYKPVKPSRFAVIFDPDKIRDLSTDLNRSSAQQMLENQKASSQALVKRMGNRGLKVLIVEDNKINQKVLTKFLEKIGVDVEIAEDGVACTDTVFSKSHDYYSMILCDIQMPRKDGFATCKEIREWERAAGLPRIPILALSANVMTTMTEKCAAAGFSDYVTKPVDFISLSKAMAQYF